jgi:mannose-6-phosphate isomerase-like protein (cupin superfamily)
VPVKSTTRLQTLGVDASRSATLSRCFHRQEPIKLFAPRGHDPQPPHTRDELYFVASGAGWFVNGEDRHSFSTGDVLFVPAGVVHRFEDFSEDLSVWVVFYGPEGGEAGTA